VGVDNQAADDKMQLGTGTLDPMWRRMIAAIALAAAVAAPAGATTSKPQLRVDASSPLRIQGLGFRPGEHVTVALVAPVHRVRRASATGRGTFVVDFGITRDRCSGLFIRAIGASGDHAVVRALPQCPPP